MNNKEIEKQVSEYYTGKVVEHGAVPRGVDWNSAESQSMRFAQLLKVVDSQENFSILDYGCGYGALAEYLLEKGFDFEYTGFDISEEMLQRAGKRKIGNGSIKFTGNGNELIPHDYLIASGIFNVRLDYDEKKWLEYILATLGKMNSLATKGFSFNVLTKYSDADKMRDHLYYADPLFLFDYCKRNFSKYLAVLHDYPIYEFTILLRKG